MDNFELHPHAREMTEGDQQVYRQLVSVERMTRMGLFDAADDPHGTLALWADQRSISYIF